MYLNSTDLSYCFKALRKLELIKPQRSMRTFQMWPTTNNKFRGSQD